MSTEGLATVIRPAAICNDTGLMSRPVIITSRRSSTILDGSAPDSCPCRDRAGRGTAGRHRRGRYDYETVSGHGCWPSWPSPTQRFLEQVREDGVGRDYLNGRWQ